MGGIQAALAEHAFEHLFIECLGWDRFRTILPIVRGETRMDLTGVAQKRGFAVFLCPSHRTVLANRALLREVQREVRRSHHEHILIHACETPRKQVWQWATTTADGRGVLHREHPFFSSEPPERLLERLEGLTIGFDEEEQTGLTDVLARVRAALAPDSDLNLFAKHPSFAAQSDRLGMAMKRNEPGALQRFVEFHMPLARKSSRMLVRWFNMDPDDAEQTAMIGLLQAARRFDPDRGYQFSTLAGYWIRNSCQRYGLRWGLPIRIPDHFFWPCYKLAFVEIEFIATYGEAIARQHFEWAREAADVTREQWEAFCAARRFSCFSDVDASRNALLGKRDDSMDVERGAAMSELQVEVSLGLRRLNERQAHIVKLRYGIGCREHTLQDVADKMGITRERVRQLQAKAEEKLVVYLEKQRLEVPKSVVASDGQQIEHTPEN